MNIETRVHLVDRDGEVLFPRGIVRGKRPFIELTDPLGGKISFATRDASGWKEVLGYATDADIAAAFAKSQLKTADLTASEELPGNTKAPPNGNTATATGNTAERLESLLTLKISKSMKSAFDQRAREDGTSAGALARTLIDAYLTAANPVDVNRSAAVVATAVTPPLHDDPLIVSALFEFEKANQKVASLLEDYPATDGLDHLMHQFQRASKILGALADFDRAPQEIVRILLDGTRDVHSELYVLESMRAANPSAAVVVGEIALRLRSSRACFLMLRARCFCAEFS